MARDRLGDGLREALAIDGERGAGRNAARSAARMISEPSRRISSLSRPTALSSLSPRKELLQTSSASRSVLWTSVGLTGRISCRMTGTPRDATCHAASEPARPPPMMRTASHKDRRTKTADEGRTDDATDAPTGRALARGSCARRRRRAPGRFALLRRTLARGEELDGALDRQLLRIGAPAAATRWSCRR